MLSNPTCHLKSSQLWGFEIVHIVSSFAVMMLSNLLFSALNLPVVTSWVLGILMLAGLRIASIGKKVGHLGFLASYLIQPRFYLGCALRKRNGNVQ